MLKKLSRFASACLLGLAPVCSLSVLAEEAPQTPSAGEQDTIARDEAASRAYFTDLELVSQDGEKLRFFTDVLKDRVVLIHFIFTHCDDACPLMVRQLNAVRELLEGQMGDPIHFVSISIDPQRDTPADMKRYAEFLGAQHDAWVFLTGEPENVNHIVKKLGQYVPDVEAHSTLMLAGNVNKRHWMKILPMVPPAGIAEKLRMLAEEG